MDARASPPQGDELLILGEDQRQSQQNRNGSSCGRDSTVVESRNRARFSFQPEENRPGSKSQTGNPALTLPSEYPVQGCVYSPGKQGRSQTAAAPTVSLRLDALTHAGAGSIFLKGENENLFSPKLILQGQQPRPTAALLGAGCPTVHPQ